MAEPPLGNQPAVLALVNDLFFVLKIGDTAKLLRLPIQFASNAPEFFERLATTAPVLMIVDLTLAGVEMGAFFERLATELPPMPVAILGYTTHADWKHTSPLHDKCTKVVTKETFSRSLAELMAQLTQPI